MERDIMTPQELRVLLKLKKGYGQYGRAVKLDQYEKGKNYAAQ